jgi:RNA polymerase sigma-70 factor (ECF subfamily)
MDGLTDERARWLGRMALPHEPALRAWLGRRPIRGLEADDVIQESYTRLITLERVDHIRNVRTYLFQTAKSVVRDHLRSAAVVRMVSVPDLESLNLIDSEPSVETLVSDREELQRLAEAIAALPEPTRTVFRLRRVEQLPQREIAYQLGMPESTVEKHVMRALAFMVERFGRGGRSKARASIGQKRVEQRRRGAGDGNRD